MSEISKKSEKNEEEEFLEYPENDQVSDFEFLKELTKDHYVEKKELTEKELKKLQNEEKRQLTRFMQEQQREEKRNRLLQLGFHKRCTQHCSGQWFSSHYTRHSR